MDVDDEKNTPSAVKFDAPASVDATEDFQWFHDMYRDHSGSISNVDIDAVDKEQEKRWTAVKLAAVAPSFSLKMSIEMKKDIDCQKQDFMSLIIDCLCLNHNKSDLIIDGDFMAILGDASKISQNGMSALARMFEQRAPSKVMVLASDEKAY